MCRDEIFEIRKMIHMMQLQNEDCVKFTEINIKKLKPKEYSLRYGLKLMQKEIT